MHILLTVLDEISYKCNLCDNRELFCFVNISFILATFMCVSGVVFVVGRKYILVTLRINGQMISSLDHALKGLSMNPSSEELCKFYFLFISSFIYYCNGSLNW